ncbi:MAG: glucosaminidase domain-containing protein, partial [Turicibacter sp.]
AKGESKSNHDTYVNACYIDEAFLVDESADYLQIFMSGYDGWVSRHALYDEASSNETWISIIPEIQVQNTSHYKVENGDLVHYISKDIRDELAYSTLIIGVAPDYLEEGQTYYSYDGNYFYEAWNNIAVNGVGAINEATPFYNYFQYLPYRSKTNYRFGELDEYIAMQGYTEKILGVSPIDSQSQLVGEGESFIMAQEQFGINGALEMAMAIHESAFGRSKIAIEKNNMFGMNATDHNPYGNATVFSSIRNGIFYHAQRYMSWGYTDALTDFRYFGSHVGNKESGMNVKYASDPYWGEKIASHYYRLDKALGLRDLNYYQLAIKQDERQIPVQANVDDVSATLYETFNEKSNILINNYPFLVVGVVGDYLQIQSDMPVSLDLNEVVMDAPYVFGTSYGYVPLQDLYRVNDQSYQIPDAINQYVQLNRGDLIDLSTHLAMYVNASVEIENPDVLSLDEASVLVARGAGVSAVSVYANDELVKVFDVRVVIPVEKVSINQVQTNLEVGQVLSLTYELLPVDASNQQVMWISSDPEVATVNELGEVVAKSVGEVVIELLSDEAGFRDEIKIKVK